MQVCLPQTDVNALLQRTPVKSLQQEDGQIDADAPVVNPAEFLQVLDDPQSMRRQHYLRIYWLSKGNLCFECDESIDQTGSLR